MLLPLLPDLTSAETSIGRDNEIEPKAGAITPAELILAITAGRVVVLSLRYLLRVLWESTIAPAKAIATVEILAVLILVSVSPVLQT